MSSTVKPLRVIYSNPVTVVFWDDGTKTLSRCDKVDTYDELTGFMLCVWKKTLPPKLFRDMLSKFVYGDDPKYIKRNQKKVKQNKKEFSDFDALQKLAEYSYMIVPCCNNPTNTFSPTKPFSQEQIYDFLDVLDELIGEFDGE